MQNIFLSDFSDERFQSAFKIYFAELGIQVKDWDALWHEMNEDENARNYAYLRLDDHGEVAGFIQFCELTMKSWFFEERVGFIREFWIRSGMRKKGNGHALLSLAEDWFVEHNIHKIILTTDTAPEFYKKHNYYLEKNITARNQDDVFVKTL